MNTFLTQRLALVSAQCDELCAIASSPLSRLARECLAHRQAALSAELARLGKMTEAFAAMDSPATAQTTREVAA